jgi:hypothetical protein
LPFPGVWLDAVHAGGRFVAVGAQDWNTGMPALITSVDGLSWHPLGDRPLPSANQVYFDGTQFVVVTVSWEQTTDEYRYYLATSPDAREWTKWEVQWRYLPRRLEFFKGRWIAIGQGLIHSSDGKTWTTLFESEQFNAAAKDDHQIMVGGQNGGIMVSSDGLNWEERSTGSSGPIYSLAKHGDTWAALTWNRLLLSKDGNEWTAHPRPVASAFLASGGDILLAVNPYVVMSSRNGHQWEQAGVLAAISGIAFTGDRFLAVGGTDPIGIDNPGRGIVLESLDGKSWRTLATPATGFLSQIAFGNNTALALTAHGGVVQLYASPPAPSLQMDSSFGLVISGRPGARYRIEMTEDLGGQWRERLTLSMQDSSEVLRLNDLPSSQAFFRAVLVE